MGYSTNFEGVIKTNRELVASEIAHLQTFMGEDLRDMEEYAGHEGHFNWLDVNFSKDFSGLQWNGSEKSYDMTHQIQFMIDRALEKSPDLVFSGKMEAQGEEYSDRWELIVNNNKAKEIKIVRKGKNVVCPLCEGEFILEEKES